MTAFIPDLVKAGLHLVRVNAAKQAMDPGWQNKPWAGDGALPDLVGLIPGRDAWAVVDVDPDHKLPECDRGPDVAARIRLVHRTLGLKPMFRVNTPSGGAHLYYRLDHTKWAPEDEIGNWKLTVGDLRCDKGYVVLWEGAPSCLLRFQRKWGQISRPDFIAKIAALRSVNAPKAPKPPKAPKGGCKATGHRRGTQEGDRHNGLLAKVRCAAENDWEPQHAIEAAVQVARAAGQPEDDIQRVVSWATEKGLATRKPHLPPWGGWTPPEQPKAPTPPAPEVQAASQPPVMPMRPARRPDTGEPALDEKWVTTSRGLAATFARRFGTNHVFSAKAWYVWRPRMGWVLDVGAGALLNAMARHGEHRFHTPDPDNPGEFVQNHIAGGRQRLHRDAIAVLPSFQGMSVGADELDADPCLVGLPEGKVFDLRSMEVRDATVEDLVTLFVPVMPRMDSDTFFHRLIEAVVPDPATREWLHRAVGSMVWGVPMLRILLFLPGVTAAGKSLVLELLKAALGPLATTMAASTFTTRARGFDVDNANALLRGTRIATISEIAANQILDPVRINSATGSDTLVSRAIGRDMVATRASHSILFAMNDLPKVDVASSPGAGAAFFDRARVVRFPHRLDHEMGRYGYQQAMKDPVELAGVLGWILQGAQRFAQLGEAPISPFMQAAAQEWWDGLQDGEDTF